MIKAINNRMVDPGMVFTEGTYMKAGANREKPQKERATKAAGIYDAQFREEVNAEREKLGRKAAEDDDAPAQGRKDGIPTTPAGLLQCARRQEALAEGKGPPCDEIRRRPDVRANRHPELCGIALQKKARLPPAHPIDRRGTAHYNG